jgi:hypothetical protein
LTCIAQNVEKRGNYNGKMGKKGGMAGETVLFPKKKLFFRHIFVTSV